MQNENNTSTLQIVESLLVDNKPTEPKKPNFEARSRRAYDQVYSYYMRLAAETLGETIDYSDFRDNYHGINKPYKFICKKHGEFVVSASLLFIKNRKRKIPCPGCKADEQKEVTKNVVLERIERFRQKRAEWNKLKESMPVELKKPIKNNEDFRKRGEFLFKDHYSYDKVNYVGLTTPVTVTCKYHGDCEVTPHAFFKGRGGCKKCGDMRRLDGRFMDYKKIMARMIELYGEKYKIIEESYKNFNEECACMCKDHGLTIKRAYEIIKSPCNKCYIETRSMGFEEFVRRAREIHGYKYKYLRPSFIDTTKHMKMVCPVHGEFHQEPQEHIRYREITLRNGMKSIRMGAGCRRCYESNPERVIGEVLDVIGVKYDREVKCGTIPPLWIDFVILRRNQYVALEYNGILHYEEIYADKALSRQKLNDKRKKDFCRSLGWEYFVLDYEKVKVKDIPEVIKKICFALNLEMEDFVSSECYNKYIEEKATYRKTNYIKPVNLSIKTTKEPKKSPPRPAMDVEILL